MNRPSNNKETDEIDTLEPLYKSKLPITVAKYNGLMRLCNNWTIPIRFHGEYRSLPYKSDNIVDTLNETDEEDDEEDF